MLVGGEVAVAVLLLFGAGLLLRTLMAVDGVDRGYRATRVLTMMVDPLGSQYPTPESLLQFFDAIEREVRTIPGVRHVAWTSTLPMGESVMGDASVEIVGDPPPTESRRPFADFAVVSPAYFPHAGSADRRRSRASTDHDTLDRSSVCIVNEAFVRHVPGRSLAARRARGSAFVR